MTFIPSVLTKNDTNNSTTLTTNTTYTGTSTLITGYNTIVVTLTSTENSNAGGLEIQFSSDNVNWKAYYTDTYFTGTIFSKTYKIIDIYYRINYTTTSATFTITSRLSTVIDNDATSINSFYSNIDDGYHDAFGKLRVSNPLTLLDIKFPSDTTGTSEFLSNNMIICTKLENATATFGSSKCVMTATIDGGYYITQSRKYCIYQPGKSLLFLASGIIDDITNSGTYTARIGYFDENNGLFFENNSGTMNIVLRNNASDTSISQTNWNIDKFDGTGISGLELNFQTSQLFVIDFEWLSVGRIRFGFYLFGRIYYCHQITNINVLTAPYMLTPNLPIRHEIRLTSSSSKVTLTQICSSVISEGGYNPIGSPFSINNGTSGIDTGITETPILALSANMSTASSSNNKYNHQNIVPSSISVFGVSNPDFLIRIRLYLAPNSPTVTTWAAVNVNSVAQYALGGGTNITNINNTNILVESIYATGKNTSVFKGLDNVFTNLTQITSDIENTNSSVLLITAQTLSGNSDIYASINWNESF